MFNLYEGNVVNSLKADDMHGTTNAQTVFRNYFIGKEPEKTVNTIPKQLEAYSRHYNLIGNVLGTVGYHSVYETSTATGGADANSSVFVLGYNQDCGLGLPGMSYDVNVRTTLMRWGNYDVASGAVRWNNSEVPAQIPLYSNAVPASHRLPASFFLTAKPSWWPSAVPWPPIGPEVTDGPGPGGHAYQIPAQVCHNNTSRNSAGLPLFNPGSCYSASAMF
jgi:hypothetical protein